MELPGSVSSSSLLVELASYKNPEVELREKKPLVSSKRKQLRVSHEKPSKGNGRYHVRKGDKPRSLTKY